MTGQDKILTHMKTKNTDRNDKNKKSKKTVKPDIIEKYDVDPSGYINTNDVFRIADLHFNKKNNMFCHLYDSYNKFIEEDVKNYLENGEHVFTEDASSTTIFKQRFKYSDVCVKEPTLSNNIEPMFPSDARHGGLTYNLKIIANVAQYQDIIDIASGNQKTKLIGHPVYNYHICTIPLMVRSKWCSLTNHRDMDKNECEYDPGGYFIVKGNEKVVISQDRMVDNKPLVFIKKETAGTLSHIVQVNSKSYKPNGLSQVMTVKIKKDGILTIRVPILNEVNVCTIFRALGIESDKDIINYISYDDNDTDMIDLIRTTLETCKNEKGYKINSKAKAVDYLISKLRVIKRYSDADRETQIYQKKIHLQNLLNNNFIPHIDGTLLEKGFYLGYIINKLLTVYLGRRPLDDRDAYQNKRIDLPGDLMMELYKRQDKKALSECKKFFDNRNKSHESPINVISNIKPNIIEQGFKNSLSTGHWIRRQGVAQMLQRLTYLQTISFLRRVDAPSGDAATSKLTGPRQLHPSSVSFLCVSGDTEILMGDNSSVELMKDMKNGKTVMTTDKETLDEIHTPITNLFCKEKNNMIELTTISGRKLKCSKDHPVLTLRNGSQKMVNAGKLKVDDQVIIRHYEKYLELDKEMKVVIKSSEMNPLYTQSLSNVLDKPIPQEKLEIFARLLGINITDGHIAKRKSTQGDQYDAKFYLGEDSDAFELHDDLKKLDVGGVTCSIGRSITNYKNKDSGINTTHKTWVVTKGGAFANMLVALGCFVGKKTTNEKKLPDWIINGNKRIKREFLSGFNGGDGARTSMQKNQNYEKLHMGGTFQTTINEHLESTIEFMESIKTLYEEFGIYGKITTEHVKDDFGDIDDTKTKVCYYPGTAYENIYNFTNSIGYRYCNEKRRNSSPVIEYVRYKNYIAMEKQQKYDKITELYNKKYTPKEIIKETNIEQHIVKRILENLRNGVCPKPRECGDGSTMKYKQFYESCGMDKDMYTAIPIKEIKDINPENAYDFTTCLNTHTFYANGFVVSNCVAQTPEHAKIGITKHLSLISTLTIMSRDQYSMLCDYLNKNTTRLIDLPSSVLRNPMMYKVFLNGDWIGMTEDFNKLITEINDMKMKSIFDQKNISIVPDHDDGEIRVYCDSGRLIRVAFKVENNELLLTKKQVESISLTKIDKLKKVTEWDEFLVKYPGVIEYIDMELQPYLMISDRIRKVREMKKIMDDSVELGKHVTNRHVENRYDEMFFLKYTHCELHPSLLVGEIITNIPFFDHNAGPRCIFAYAQGRQAMGIYATNYRDRKDISFILYYPQRPLVSTRSAKYTNSEILPAGENATVAIACYTGYNQEDSLIFNLTSMQRLKFSGKFLKKYQVSVQKNQSTSQDDVFMKPEASKVMNMKHGSYDKLNDKGYAPEETKLDNGDAIFGKVTPVGDASSTGKPYRDSSELFKMNSGGVVDRMYIDVQNQDGYLTREASIRSFRVPRIGDKYSSRHGQKGTIGILLDDTDMPFNKHGVRPDIILNPNAVPSRMTIGQLLESLVGKVAALQGMDADGTAFEEHDIEFVKNKLEELGYERNGYEELYNGMTGEKMKVQIFMGPTFYQRLKHLVEDKIHSRSRGPKTSLTRQAPEGRARDGGLRLGEMERDALLAHGLAKFIKEKLLDNSDAYTTYVCDKCGLFARRFDRKENKIYSTDGDVYYCPSCKNYNDISKIKIPYAFKLFAHEMMAMCIAPRIRCKNNVYNA
jgi:DNA-directed RNA polymerase beta subunit/intein/homing endonuclease